MFFLWDVQKMQQVAAVKEKEHAVEIVGWLMTFLGDEFCQNRFVLAKRTRKNGTAKTVYPTNELWARALVYFNQGAWQKNKQRQRRIAALGA